MQYIEANEDYVAVMAPVCGPFGPLGRLNRSINPDRMRRACEEQAPLAHFCGRVALKQCQRGRHFIQEQPYPSDLYNEVPWPQVLSIPGVVQTVYDRCTKGLCVISGQYKGFAIKKPSSMTASCHD